MHDYEDALREVLNRVYRNTDDREMRISKDCYKLIREALEKQIPKKPWAIKVLTSTYVRYAIIGFYLPTKRLLLAIHSAIFVGRSLTGRR